MTTILERLRKWLVAHLAVPELNALAEARLEIAQFQRRVAFWETDSLRDRESVRRDGEYMVAAILMSIPGHKVVVSREAQQATHGVLMQRYESAFDGTITFSVIGGW